MSSDAVQSDRFPSMVIVDVLAIVATVSSFWGRFDIVSFKFREKST
jgi:hypothetical protein